MAEPQKPKFDPNKPFEVVESSGPKPKFDPSQPFDVLEHETLSLDEPSMLETATAPIKWLGDQYESYITSPTRAAHGALLDGKNPLSAFAKQFGEDPKNAPSGFDLAVKRGASQDRKLVQTADQRRAADRLHSPGQYAAMEKAGAYEDRYAFSPAQIEGFAYDVLDDPLNILPGYAAAKGAARGGLAIAKGAAKAGGALARTTSAGAKTIEASQKMAQIVADTAKATGEALSNVFKPKQADDWAKWSEIANKNGIDPASLPESVEFGPNSVVDRTARAVREGPVGQESMDRFKGAVLAVDSAVDDKLAKISGGLPLNDIEAGQVIRQGYDDAVERLFNDVDFTYDTVIAQAPGMRLTEGSMQRLKSKLAGIEKWAKGRIARGITRSDKEQGAQLLRAIEAIRMSNGSLKQTYEAMQDIGRHAFKVGPGGKQALSDVPTDIEKFRDLYFTMRDEFIETTAKSLGPDVANSLIDSNQQLTMFLNNKKAVAQALNNKALAPEKLFKSLIVGGDTNKIAALKEMLTPEQFNQLKGSYLASLIKRNPDETINFGALRTLLQKNRTTLSVLFEPQEISDFIELVQLGERFGPAVLSTSGTGGSNIFRNFAEGVQSGATNRTVLEGMKDSARGRSAKEAAKQGSKQKLKMEAMPPSSKRLVPGRTRTEEALKYLQIKAAQENSQEKQSAAQRRMEALKRLNGGQ